MIEFSLPLYYKPGPDMDIEGKENFDPEILKKHGQTLKEELEETTRILKILRKNGWDYQGALYDISCYKDIGVKEAQVELKKLGIDIDPENLIEIEEEM